MTTYVWVHVVDIILALPKTYANMMSTANKSPYADHPLFHLRRCLLLFSTAGFILCLLLLGNNDVATWVFTMVFFLLSIFLTQVDYTDWKDHTGSAARRRAIQHGQRVQPQAQTWQCPHLQRTCSEPTRATDNEHTPLLSNPSALTASENLGSCCCCNARACNDDRINRSASEDYVWPRRSIMLADFVLACISVGWLNIEFANIRYSYGYGYYHRVDDIVCKSYISACTLLVACIHARSWWLEFMARRKQQWERERKEDEDGTEGETTQDGREESGLDLEAGYRQDRGRDRACGRNRDVGGSGGDHHRHHHGLNPTQPHDINEQIPSNTEESRILSRVLKFLGREDSLQKQDQNQTQNRNQSYTENHINNISHSPSTSKPSSSPNPKSKSKPVSTPIQLDPPILTPETSRDSEDDKENERHDQDTDTDISDLVVRKKSRKGKGKGKQMGRGSGGSGGSGNGMDEEG